MARALKQVGFNVSLICKDLQIDQLLQLDIFDQIKLFKTKMPIQLKGKTAIRSYITRRINIEFDEFALNIIHRAPPCAVISQYVWTTGILTRLPSGVLGILDTIDVQHLRAQVARANNIVDFDRKATKKQELNLLRKVDVITAIQPQEKAYLQQCLPNKKIICAAHAITPEPMPSPQESLSILFAASRYDPNIKGIEHFITISWPEIIKAVPNASLHICGKVCENLVKYQQTKGINLHGVVPNLDEFYQNAAVVINPALYGTGLPIKTAEALAFGKCLVCNAPSVRGFDPVSFPGIVCNYETMPQHIIPLLLHPGKRRIIEKKTVAFTTTYMTPHVVYDDIFKLLDQHCVENQLTQPHLSLNRSLNLRTKLSNYPLCQVFYHYAAIFFSHLFEQNKQTKNLDPQLLEMYLRLRWRELYRDHNIKRVAIFGAGKHSAWLANVVHKIDGPVVAVVVDDNPDIKSKVFGLTPINSKMFNVASVDSIILSSDYYQEQMAMRCRKLYRNRIRLINLYEGLPPGPYRK